MDHPTPDGSDQADDRPVSPAFADDDEAERMAEEERPPAGAMALRAGTRQQLKARYSLGEEVAIAILASLSLRAGAYAS